MLAGVPGRWLTEDVVKRAFRLPEAPAWTALLPDLTAMREVYLALMRVGRRPAWCPSLWQLVHMTAEEAGTADVTALASILAMADMGLFRIEQSPQAFSITRSARIALQTAITITPTSAKIAIHIFASPSAPSARHTSFTPMAK